MIEINLLPWRTMLRTENEKRIKSFLTCASTLALLWILIHIGFNWAKQSYDATIANLQDQLTELTNQIQQNSNNPALPMIETIHSNQIELIHFFKILEQTIKPSLFIKTIESKHNRITLTGNADSFNSLTHFVTAYNEKNKIFPMTILSSSNNDDVNATQFRLQLTRSASPFSEQIKNDTDDNV